MPERDLSCLLVLKKETKQKIMKMKRKEIKKMQERALVWLLVLIPLAACAANLPFVNDSPRYRVCMTGVMPVMS